MEEFLEAARIFQEYSDLYNKIRVSAFRPRKGGELGECYCLDYKALQLSADAMVLGECGSMVTHFPASWMIIWKVIPDAPPLPRDLQSLLASLHAPYYLAPLELTFRRRPQW